MGDSAELLARVTGVPVSSRAQVLLLQELASATSGARQGASTST